MADGPTYTGAHAFWEAATAAGVDVCFANPGTTEISLVQALESTRGMRAVLGLFEGVCTGAADGYGRMLGRPALTLLHLGPGFANGIANLHNARRARSPIVNVIGDHASWHVQYDAPLTSDIHSLAKPVSAWVKTVRSAQAIARDTRAAIRAAMQPPGHVATLVLPMDFQAEAVTRTRASKPRALSRVEVPGERIEALARVLKAGSPVVFLLGGSAMSPRGQRAAARIATVSQSRFYSETFPARAARGGGLPDIDRLPYFPEAAMKAFEGAAQVVLAGALAPVAYFGYPGLPSRLAPEEKVTLLAEPGEDAEAALEALAEALGAPASAAGVTPSPYVVAEGALSPQSIGRVLSNALPEGAIVSVEGGTCGYPFVTASAQAAFHEVLTNTGGAIGQGIPCAVGAAIAAPDRRVFSLQSDGSALYTIQALWTAAREQLDLTVLIASNRRYAILQNELARAGTGEPGAQARRLTELDHPALDWQALAKAHGVAAVSVSDNAALARELAVANAERGPRLIEMVL